jgi:hypothetical protein
VLVRAGGQAAPGLHQVEGAFDGVAAEVDDRVVVDEPTACWAAAGAVTFLVVGFENDAGDAAFAKVRADRPRGVRVVARYGFWSVRGRPGP